MSEGWTRVAAVADVPVGRVFGLETAGERIVLANVDGEIYALEDQCSHAEFPLSEGELDGTRLECSFHGAKFDVCTGRAVQLPAIRPVRTFEVDVREGEIFLRLG